MTIEASNTSKPTARQKLEASQLDPRLIQRELLGSDFDTDALRVYLSGKLGVDVTPLLVDATVTRTVEGASTVELHFDDYNRELLQSHSLTNELDIEVDGLFFRLAKVEKSESDDRLILTFEDREIAVLRSYNKKKTAARQHTTRAEFILNLIREVKEFRIPVVIPELHIVQAVSTAVGIQTQLAMAEAKQLGISEDQVNGSVIKSTSPFDSLSRVFQAPNDPAPVPQRDDFTNKKVLVAAGVTLTSEQRKNANTILQAGVDLGVRRKLLVCAIMTALDESTLRNIPYGDNAHGGGPNDSIGLFQQDSDWGTFAERMDPATAARSFYKAAINHDAEDPFLPYWELCHMVQGNLVPEVYAPFRGEADKIVTAFGVPGADNATGAAAANGSLPSTAGGASDYIYYRGKPLGTGKGWQKENSWDCIQRLADEVDWRAFFVSGTFYYLSEDVLFAQQPIATLTEFADGILGMGGDLDTNKRSATVSLNVNLGRWLAPPGSVIELINMGPWDGRWLVYEIDRSLFNNEASITLQKPRPKLKEPAQNDVTVQAQVWNWSTVPVADPPRRVTGTDVPVPGISRTDLQFSVLHNKKITFSNSEETSDIEFGRIDVRVLKFLIWMVNNGWPCHISALKSDHNHLTTQGNISAHSAGKAVDVDTYNAGNPDTDQVMRFIAAHQVELGFSQLIGPNRLLWVGTVFNQELLNEHQSHIHVGWAL